MRSSALSVGVACVALATGVTACGNSSSGGSEELTPKAVAQEATFKLTDIPKGWRAEPLVRVGGRCGKSPLESADAVKGAHFEGRTADVQELLGVFATRKLAQHAYSALRSPEELRCFKHISERGMELYSGGKVLQPLRGVHSPTMEAGEDSLWKATLRTPIGPVAVYVERLAAKVGRAVILVKVTSGFNPPPPTLYREVTKLPFVRAERAEDSG